jgi:purine-nucleoside phosphorylase
MASTSLYERAEHATRIIRSRISVEPRIALVLGSGLGGFAEDFEEAVAIPYEDIPGFVRSTAQGHAGRLVIGKIDTVPVLAMQGRVHYYEGYSLEEVTFPVRTFGLLGVKTLVLSHFVPAEDSAITDKMWIDAARTHFDGEVVMGKDLLEL